MSLRMITTFVLAFVLASFPLCDSNCFSQSTSTQVVFLDFDSGVECPQVYTNAMREEIQEILEGYFRGFDVEFSLVQPTSGKFSTILFNEGANLAEDVDSAWNSCGWKIISSATNHWVVMRNSTCAQF